MTHKLVMTTEDLFIVVRTVFGEARGEPEEGKRAVAHVIFNRANARDMTITHACLQSALVNGRRIYQFSCHDDREATNYQQMMNATVNVKAYRECMAAVIAAFDEEDFTRGATHYHTRDVKPYWSTGHEPSASIGAHLFYNTVK